jgi:hypothetical protein
MNTIYGDKIGRIIEDAELTEISKDGGQLYKYGPDNSDCMWLCGEDRAIGVQVGDKGRLVYRSNVGRGYYRFEKAVGMTMLQEGLILYPHLWKRHVLHAFVEGRNAGKAFRLKSKVLNRLNTIKEAGWAVLIKPNPPNTHEPIVCRNGDRVIVVLYDDGPLAVDVTDYLEAIRTGTASGA